MKTILFYLFLVVSVPLIAQTIDSAPYGKLDTLKYYSVSLSYSNMSGKAIYTLNGKETDAATYQKYKAVWDNINRCTPCYAKTYDINDQLINEGERYQDCQIGQWIEYYPNGAVKLTGEFKINETGNWKNAWDRGYCSRKEGKWAFYDENGNLTRTETWENGKKID